MEQVTLSITGQQRRSALCVGVSRYQDKNLGELASAADSAKTVARALEKSTFGVRVVANPGSSLDLFETLQKAVRDAREGTFLFYFAGHVIERGDDLLLAMGDCDAKEKKGGVPWSDVEDLLKRERVTHAIFVINAEKHGAAAGLTGLKHPSVHAVGAARKPEP
jgi:hypothetical protein